MATTKKIWTYFVIAFIAFCAALNYELFVFPNAFASSGLNGICTMIQHITGISVGSLSLVINLPLAAWCFYEVSRPMAIRSMVYVIVFSVSLLILDHVDLSVIAYSTENGTSRIMGPLVAGIIMGFCYSVLIKASAYTGGTDFISAIIHKRHPEKSVFSLSFVINAIVAIGSFFVYDYKVEPVIMCIVYSFASTTVGERFLKSGRSAVRFEIVTNHPDDVCNDIIQILGHSATKYRAVGAYTGRETWIVVCVINNNQTEVLSDIVRKYPKTFAIMMSVTGVMGNFKKLTDKGQPVLTMLDEGDGQTI